MNIYKNTSVFLLFATLIVSFNSYAAPKLPSHYPTSFNSTGFVVSINVKARILDLNGAQLETSPLVEVHTLDKKTILFTQLKENEKIGVTFENVPGKAPQVRHIWILPANYPTVQMM